ncbi:hypothetical protein TWF506_001252 [Arthrobotrys conoides]|uniref:Uncharacterized protein n=1 Tax=Arthrobotrys conoides TaxID=74498 RepID=A0AAN8NFS5_9PEZI
MFETADIVFGGNTGDSLRGSMPELADADESTERAFLEPIVKATQTVGDLFYPDNPKRRDRLEQLKSDIATMKDQVVELKADIDKIIGDCQAKVTKLLHDSGYQSVDDLEKKVKEVLPPSALQEWEGFKRSFDLSNNIENLVFTVTSFVTIGTGVIGYGLAVFGIIGFATAGAALAFVTSVSTVLAIIVTIIAIINAGEERTKLREAISKLAYTRFDARAILSQMEIYKQHAVAFQSFVDNKLFSGHPELFPEFTATTMGNELKAITRESIIQKLQALDQQRTGGAYTDDDPDLRVLPAGAKDVLLDFQYTSQDKKPDLGSIKKQVAEAKPISLIVASTPAGTPLPWVKFQDSLSKVILKFACPPSNTVRLRCISSQDQSNCDAIAVDTNEKWHIEAKTRGHINTRSTAFKLRSAGGTVWRHCIIVGEESA